MPVNKIKTTLWKAAKHLVVLVGAGIVYYLVARLGLAVASLNTQVSPVWPATGIAAWVVFVGGLPAALGVFIAAFLANFGTGLAAAPSLLIASGNTAEALVGIFVFNFLMKYKDEYGVHSRAIFAVFTIAVATMVSATIGTLALLIFKVISTDAAGKNWITWWIGDVIGCLFLIPFAYKIYRVRSAAQSSQSAQSKQQSALPRKFPQLAFLFGLTFLLNFFVFETGFGTGFLFVIFLPLLLAAIWMDSLWIYILSFITCTWAIFSTISGSGPFIGNQLNENLIHLQLFLMGLGITALGLGSLKQERLPQRTVLALLAGWILSGLSFYSFYNSNQEIDTSRFAMRTEQAENAIHSRLKDYIAILDSGSDFFNASNFVTRAEWKSFTERLILNEDYSSIESLTVAFATPVLDKNVFHKIHNLANELPDPSFASIPIRETNHIVAEPETNLIITYVEPYSTKKKVVGLNLSSEKNRYEAILRARDTGAAAASGYIHLTLDKVARPAFILFLPIYKNEASVLSIPERQAAFRGVIYAPIIFDKFITSSLGRLADDVHLTVSFDSQIKAESRIVFESKSTPINRTDTIVKHTTLGGQPITYTWRKASTFQPSSSLIYALISFLGALLSLLLAMMLSSLQNLTTRAQELAAHQTKEILAKNRVWKLLTDTSPVAIFLTDPNGKCTYANPMWGKLTGRSPEAALGDQWIDAIHPEDLDSVMQSWQNLFLTGNFDCQYRFLLPDESIADVRTKSVPLLDEHGKINGYLGIIQDMTDSVKKTNALLASSRMSSLGEMASGIAHEINNPLSIILGNADLLDSHLDSDQINLPKVKHYLNQMTTTVHRIAKIIRGLRSFARETSKEPFEKCRIKDVIGDTLELCRERFRSNGVKLILPSEIDSEIYFSGRSEQIAQVLLNLLNNGFDAAVDAKEKWLEIKVKIQRGKIQIKITDSGLGIDAEHLQKIFEPFYTSKKVGHGTGLGLSISKGIIAHHHGRLYIDKSAANTTFVVELEQLLEELQPNLT